MPKEVRIARGLDSMGALRSDGSGSVLKGKRKGELVTAIKILPVTIHPKSAQYDHFQKAAEKLREINREPNPNLVKILHFGLSEVGSHPFIETKFVDGPDLEELVNPPYDRIFTLFEVLKVADHLANALAQAHQAGVVHGNIKFSNVKFDLESSDYVLVGFGLSTLTQKQRHGLKLEDTPFIAPELKEGKLSFQADIFSYGMIIYQLLAGSAPFLEFQTTETGSSSKAALSVLLDTRRENLPGSWSHEQRESEMQVPQSLLEIVARCLQVQPENRFSSGADLQETLVGHSSSEEENSGVPAILLQQENDRLRSMIIHNKELAAVKEEEVARLKALINHREEQLNALKYQMGTIMPETTGVSIPKVVAAVLVVACLGAGGTYLFLSERSDSERPVSAYADTGQKANEASAQISDSNVKENVLPASAVNTNADTPIGEERPLARESSKASEVKSSEPDEPVVKREVKRKEEPKAQVRRKEERTEPRRRREPDPEPAAEPQYEPVPYRAKYTLQSTQAFFYGRPEESARRNLVLIPSDNTELVAVEDSNGFIYVSFFDAEGKSVRGWLRKQDLRRLN